MQKFLETTIDIRDNGFDTFKGILQTLTKSSNIFEALSLYET
jgi:hypothetical protein